MTSELLERFWPVLESLEKERLKVVRDQKAYLFLILLSSFLALCCLIAAALGPSRLVLSLGLLLLVAAFGLSFARDSLDRAFQTRFRNEFTRDWFRTAYPGAFLAPAPSTEQIPLEVSRSLREACLRATAQNPRRTSIEERLFFDDDTYRSWAFVLAERSRWSKKIRSRALVWFRANSSETALVAFAWPPLGLSREPDVRFFINGKLTDAEEPLRSKLLDVYGKLRAKAGSQPVRVSLSPTGVWAGVKLAGGLFEAPVIKSVLDPLSYTSWTKEASLLADREIHRSLLTL